MRNAAFKSVPEIRFWPDLHPSFRSIKAVPHLLRARTWLLAVVACVCMWPGFALASGGHGPTNDNAQTQTQSPASVGDVVNTAMKYENHGNVTGFRGPWCKAFVNMIMKETGHNLPDNSLRARDSVSLGRRVVTPVAGAVFVQPHHTGFVIRPLDGGQFLAISGNYGHRVRVAVFQASSAHFVIPD